MSETSDNPFVYGPCTVCASEYRILLRYVGTARTKKRVPLYMCLACGSFSCANNYKEDDCQLKADAQYHVGLVGQKARAFKELAEFLRHHAIPGPAADIGCAVGVLANALHEVTKDAHGYDLNPYAIEEGKRLFPHLAERLHCAPFGSDGRKFAVITLVDTMEHVAEPIPLMQTIAEHLLPGGLVYITVPRLDRDKWSHLKAPSIYEFNEASPLGDVDVHVTHFSRDGLSKLGENAGLQVLLTMAFPWPMNETLFIKPK
jgi:SAM-dependent methyltransferase